MNVAICAAPCISGGAAIMISGPALTASSTTSCGVARGSPYGLPPPKAMNRSSTCHMAPLGMPVVPPV
jgi:hypothetical protein